MLTPKSMCIIKFLELKIITKSNGYYLVYLFHLDVLYYLEAKCIVTLLIVYCIVTQTLYSCDAGVRQLIHRIHRRTLVADLNTWCSLTPNLPVKLILYRWQHSCLDIYAIYTVWFVARTTVWASLTRTPDDFNINNIAVFLKFFFFFTLVCQRTARWRYRQN